MGCYISHLDILTDARTRHATPVLVLEDDASPRHALLSSLLATMPARWDMLYLSYNDLVRPHPGVAFNASRSNDSAPYWRKLPRNIHASDTAAYAVSTSALDRIVRHLLHRLSQFRSGAPFLPVDLVLWELQGTMEVYVAAPSPAVVQRNRFRDSDVSFYSWSHMTHEPYWRKREQRRRDGSWTFETESDT